MIKATVYEKKLSVENVTVSDSVKFDTVKFVFPEKWENYQKTAVFKTDDGIKINVLLDEANPMCLSKEECYIPHEVLISPCFYLSVFGVKGESIATTTLARVKVLKSGYTKGRESSSLELSEYEQIMSALSAKADKTEIEDLKKTLGDFSQSGESTVYEMLIKLQDEINTIKESI